MSVDDVASTKAATAIASAVTRTATDALNSKYSAIILADYPVLSSAKQPHNDSKSVSSDNDALYRRLLQSMAACFFNNNHTSSTPSKNTTLSSVRRQTPLINLGYAIRVANVRVLHHVEAFVSFHEQQQQHNQYTVSDRMLQQQRRQQRRSLSYWVPVWM
jgi:hypothetical protein